MQSTIALSPTEAEYVALSTALRDVLYVLELVKEFNQYGIDIPNGDKPAVKCRVFEDNVGCVELATEHKLRPRTKHLAVQYRHFRHYVTEQVIKVEYISTKDQLADIFTKPLPRDTFQYLRRRFMGW